MCYVLFVAESEALDDVVRRAAMQARRDGEDRELVLRRIAGEEDAKRALQAVLGSLADATVDPNGLAVQVHLLYRYNIFCPPARAPSSLPACMCPRCICMQTARQEGCRGLETSAACRRSTRGTTTCATTGIILPPQPLALFCSKSGRHSVLPPLHSPPISMTQPPSLPLTTSVRHSYAQLPYS
jgi:hypothetical protein